MPWNLRAHVPRRLRRPARPRAAADRRPDAGALPPAGLGRASGRLRPLQLAIVLLALVGAVLAAGIVDHLGNQRAIETQEHLTEHIGDLLRQRVEQAADLVVGARALFEASPHVSRAEFRSFAGVSLGYSGLLALGWIPRVAAAQRTGFEAALGRRISDPAGTKLRTAARRPQYYPLLYLAPWQAPGSDQILGLDLATLPEMQGTLAAARDSGEPTLSAELPMLGAGSVILFAPAYTPGPRPGSAVQRRARLLGFVAAAYRTEALVGGARADLPAGATMQVLDHGRPVTGPSGQLADASSQEVPILRRAWTVRVKAASSSTLLLPAGILTAGGLFAALVALLLSIGNRRQEALRRQRDYVRGLVGAMQDGFVMLAPNGRISEVSPGFCQMTGFSRDQLIGVGAPYPYWPEAGMDGLRRGFERVQREGSGEWDLLFCRSDGERFPVILKASVVEDERGDVAGFLATVKDVTQRVRAEREQARQASIVRAVLDTTPEAIRMVDLSGRTVIANAAAEQLAGWPADNDAADAYARVEELIERSTDPERLRSAMQALRERPDRSDRVDFELAGSGRVFRLYSAPVRLDGDPASIIGRMFVTREVTEERDGERVKDEFIQLASHELRTPLTSILGYLEAVRDGEVGRVSPEQDRFLGVIERNAQRLLRLVGDLLLVSRVDAGRLGLEMEELDLGDLALECAQASQPRADAGQIALTVEAEPLLMHGDRTRLSEVVDNLLSNALKFTPPGGAVGVRVFASDEEAVLEVRDTGMGISDADQERLFERFFRAEAAMAAAIPGTGLGLCISKMLVEAHGGRIGVESESDGGAVFRVSLPLARVPALTR